MTYILVEGLEDKIFINYILTNILKVSDDLFKIEHNGKDNNSGSHGIIQSRLESIEKSILNNQNVIIINDADNSYVSRKKELENKINTDLVPNIKARLNGKALTNIRIEIFLYPNNKDSGIFEDMLLECIPKGNKIPNCFDSFVECLSNIKDEYNLKLPVIKTKIYSYVDVQNNDTTYKRDKDGSYFYRKTGLWDFNSKAIQPLLDFLSSNIK